MPDHLPNYILFGLFLLLYAVCIVRVLAKKLAPQKTVRAKVVDKGKEKVFTKLGAYGKSERYYVVFQTEEKKLSFYVGHFSYDGYRKGETGKLTYKGDRIIDFH